MKIVLSVVLGLALLVGGYAAFTVWVRNPQVTAELRAEPDGETAKRVMLLTLPSGRTLPVNYLLEDGFVYAGADGTWWKEMRGEGAAVTVFVRGQTLQGHGRAIEDDADRRTDVFSRLRPNAVEWAGTLVAIELAEPGAVAP